MFGFGRNKESTFSKNKKIREIQEHYDALNQINNERVKQMSNYAKSLEHVLKRYNAVEEQYDVELNQTHEDKDYSDMIGELARCITLQNLYLDKEEYEKCAIMKIRIMELSEKLNIPIGNDLTNLGKDDEN